MNPFYIITFAALAACTGLLEYRKAHSGPKPYANDKSFLSFRNNYILVYSLMMGARWRSGLRCYWHVLAASQKQVIR